MRDWREHDEAVAEFRSAVAWYEQSREGLGQSFYDAAETALTGIRDESYGWRYYRGRVSTPQVLVRGVAGFPIQIVYVIIDETVVVVAYAHERRRPAYWEPRLAGLDD